MLEFLRAIRVGAVNLFGVAIPGFLLLFTSIFGFVVPVCLVGLLCFGASLGAVGSLYKANEWIVIVVFVILSYVTGYILRLTSPDELDEVSGERVLREMEPEGEKELWPYTGKKNGDKFPYLNLRRYLDSRGLSHLLSYVPWGEQTNGLKPSSGKRSKTAVHEMKLLIKLSSPELASEVESNEAHIRLMSGTWIAVRQSKNLVQTGWITCMVAFLIAELELLRVFGLEWKSALTPDRAAYLFAYGIALFCAVNAMNWAQRTIERLFHYRRVNELVWLVMSAHEAKRIADERRKAAGRQEMKEGAATSSN